MPPDRQDRRPSVATTGAVVRGPFCLGWVVSISLVLNLVQAGTPQAQPSESISIEQAIERLRDVLHAGSRDYFTFPIQVYCQAVATVDRASTALSGSGEPADSVRILSRLERLGLAEQSLDRLLADLLAMRHDVAKLPQGDDRNVAVRNFLKVSSELIDLVGRLQYELAEAIGDAAYQFAGQPVLREELIDQLIVSRSGMGASIMSWALLDPPASSPNRAQPASAATKARLLAMIAWSGRSDALPVVVQFLRSGQATPELAIVAAETVRHLGLPQDPRPGGDPRLPPPAIAAAELHRIVSNIDTRTLSDDLRRRRAELLEWLMVRTGRGFEDDGLHVGKHRIQPGDWLLMRNSSPYNLFTSLSPGLFTHISVVAQETDPTGYERMVVVEITERGTRVSANNVESVLNVPLYYTFLRHQDPAAGRRMGEVAASLIGNELEYDLQFETGRVAELLGKPLAGRKIKTYCAGLPLICAQETHRPRQEFFPIDESPAGGRTVENLSKLGLRFGNDLVSPTGAMFSSSMQIVARSEHLYAPGRAIEQGIYDHFATSVGTRELAPTATLLQSLRLKLAAASKSNPLLARALAAAAGVSADIDLLTAAKTLAVIETLGEIVTGNSKEFLESMVAVYGGPSDDLARSGLNADDVERILTLRTHHAELRRRAEQGQLSARNARDTLVQYYIDRGTQQVDERFFSGAPNVSQ